MLSTPLRNSLNRVAAAANNDLAGLWRQVSTAVEAREALKDVLPALVDRYGAAAAVLAAQWYDNLRARHAVKGSFAADPADLSHSMGSAGSVEALAGVGVGPLFSQTPDWAAARSLIAGGLQYRIASYARTTVMGATAADPSANGWQRETAGGCAFCLMLASRATLYRSEDTADFASHPNCNCSAVPAFAGVAKPVRPYTPSSRNITDADRARVREYLRTH